MGILDGLRSWIFRRRRWVLSLGAAFGLYTLFGFLALPGILKGRLERALSEATHRRATVQRVKVNPLVLSVTVEGLAIADRRGGAWVACERIYANAQLFPLFARTLKLKELDLIRPSMRIELDAAGKLDFSDLLVDDATTPKPEPKTPGAWTFAVDRFNLAEGRLPFVDRTTDPDFSTALGPLSFQMEGLRTTPGSSGGAAFQAISEKGERLSWRGSLGLDPLLATGRIQVEGLLLAKYGPYLKESLSLDLRQGRLDLGADYRLAWGPQEKAFRLENGSGKLAGLEIAEPGAAPSVSLSECAINGVQADLLANRVVVQRIAAQGGRLAVDRNKAGQLNLERLLAPPPGWKPKPKDPEAKPLDLSVQEIQLSRFGIAWTDAVPIRPVEFALEDLELGLKGLSLDPKGTANLKFSARAGEAGRLALEGQIKPFAAVVDFQVQAADLPLPPFDPYLAPATDLRIAQGKLGMDGRLRATLAGKPTDTLRYTGDAWIERLEAADGRDSEVLLRWKRLALKGLETGTAPLSVKLKTLTWTDPEGRLVVAPDGTTNVARALRLAADTPPQAAASPPSAPAGQAPFPLSIALMQVTNGRLSFVDRSLTPSPALILQDLGGSYEQLTTEPGARSQLRFTGKAGGVGPLRIEGKAYPLRTDRDSDVKASLQGAELTDFDGYSRKYLGYILQKGKLGADLSLKIQDRKLNALAKVKLDQLFLGDKVESKEATWIPVKLALALVRDRHGVIDLEIPVDGSLDDPEFHYGRMVWKALLNLLAKAATSPFQLLGKLFGGGADLSAVAFAPGSAELPLDSAKVIGGLVKALQERPGIGLELEGATDPAADAASLRRVVLEARIRDQAWKNLGRPGRTDEAFAPDPTQREAALRALHQVAFPVDAQDPKAPKGPAAPAAEVENRLLGKVQLDPEALRRLAEARTEAIRTALTAAGAPMDRVFAVKGTLKAEQAASKVWFAVK
jgi:uncharacterized protein involved in outer membrane biogenesis